MPTRYVVFKLLTTNKKLPLMNMTLQLSDAANKYMAEYTVLVFD